MTDDITKSESKLRKLGEKLRQAWAKQHPLTPKELETVRQAVRKQWEAERRVAPMVDRHVSAPPSPPNQRPAHEREQERQNRARHQKQIRDQGHSH